MPERDRFVQLPYLIDHDKWTIGELNIKMSGSEKWTTALKYMLTNLKWLLAWCARAPAVD